MSASLIRTGSVPVQNPGLPGSPRISLSRQTSFAGDKNHVQSPRLSLHFHSNDHSPLNGINRALSESAAIRRSLSRTTTRSFPAIIPDEEEFLSVGARQQRGVPAEDIGFGGGYSDGRDHGVEKFTGWNGDERIKISAYYEEMLKSNPTDALLLRNYGKFLHEVEKDTARAEEYYGRAILANPGDGELLSLYGNLIWETEGNEERAKSYFDQAIHAAPDDCTVLGSYARFMWETEEEEEEEEQVNGVGMKNATVEVVAAC